MSDTKSLKYFGTLSALDIISIISLTNHHLSFPTMSQPETSSNISLQSLSSSPINYPNIPPVSQSQGCRDFNVAKPQRDLCSTALPASVSDNPGRGFGLS
ncbi:hypothetical protein ABVK25_005162 [Lepraria finkii]|uniref:Uncharacterized protein n=1 Tax=Lepraria finkii TaxID=1340010 RepID=A0ABR4B993_9LECA